MYFDQSAASSLLASFVASAEEMLFPGGCPERPTAKPVSGDGSTCTSLGTSLEAPAFGEAPIHVPVGFGKNPRHTYKSELVLVRDPGVRTLKMLWWHDRDPRAEPHCHPWNFRSAILAGGYDEVRYWLDEAGEVQQEQCSWVAGNINVVPANVFHCVTNVQPGTVTLLDCGPANSGNAWGYLDPETGIYRDQKELAAPQFGSHFSTVNPHRAS